ncbi:MAG: TIM-barrel domain-containing protein [Candidatus Kryptoniota bacterium]
MIKGNFWSTLTIFILGLLILSYIPLCNAQVRAGNLSYWYASGKTVQLHSGPSVMRITFYRSDVVRIDLLPDSLSVPDSSFVVIRDTSTAIYPMISEKDSSITVTSGHLTVNCMKYPIRLTLSDAFGNIIMSEGNDGGFTFSKGGWSYSFHVQGDEHFYGTGERANSLDLRGLSFDSFNTQTGGYGQPAPNTMNVNIPFVISSRNYGIFFDDTYPGHFDIACSNPEMFTYSADSGKATFYFIASQDMKGVLRDYTWLTGRAPLLPKWAYGYIQSKYGYHNYSEASGMIQRMRADSIPCDAIVLDLYWFRNMGDLSWNVASWPNPPQIMSDFISRGFKTIVITEPYIVQPSVNYQIAIDNGYFAKGQDGQPYILPNWWSCSCNAGLLDITNPAAESWWWNKYISIFSSGVSGLWTDLGEPERDHPDMNFYLGSDSKVHNIYDFLWARTLYDGFNQSFPGRRLFNLTRSGYAGIQRFATVTWSGDVSKTFGGLAVQLPMLLNMGMSGISYHNSDIGGFTAGITTPELYARWMEFGTFCPITRAHGTGGAGTEPWVYGLATEKISKEYINLRYELFPYIYSTAYQSYLEGMPLARPLILEFPEDPNLYNESSSYMWGDAFLVSPVVKQGETSKSIYLPLGNWVDFWTDSLFTGGDDVVVNTPVDRLPLFVRSGSIIPMHSLLQDLDSLKDDSLLVEIYPSVTGKTSFTLYEDDGTTLDYQKGMFSATTFSQQVTLSGSIARINFSISKTSGSFPGSLFQKVLTLDFHQIVSSPKSVIVNGEKIYPAQSLDVLKQNYSGYYFDDVQKRLYVRLVERADTEYSIIIDSTSVTGVNLSSPTGFELQQNYPNPFNSSTTISFFLNRPERVVIKVYDVLGRLIKTLLDENLSAGAHSVKFDGRNYTSGIYFYRLMANSYFDCKSMALIK